MTSIHSAEQAARPDPRGLLARHPLLSFFVIAYLIAWVVEAPVVLAANGALPAFPPLAAAMLIAAATLGPTAAAFIVTGLTEGRPGVGHLLRRYMQWRIGVRWYLFVLLGMPAVIVLGAVVVPGSIDAFQAPTTAMLAGYPLAFLMTFLLGGPLGEEPGWRGFALPRLQARLNPLASSVVLGVLWALWHLPLFWSGVWTPPTVPNILMFVVMITALTTIMTWVFNHADGSVLITMLMHASFNTFANKIAAPMFPTPLLDEYGLLPVLIGFVATAVVLAVATRGHLGYLAPTAPGLPGRFSIPAA